MLLLLAAGLCMLSAAPRMTSYDRSDNVYAERADSLTGFDVTKYEITLSVNDVTHNISGNAIAHVTSESNLTAIDYNLLGLTVSEVRVNNAVAPYTYTNGIIHIPVNFANGVSFTTQVTYSGVPSLSNNAYHIGMIFNPTMVFTLSDPDACRQWWPCYDHPWDKAVVDLHITMRSDWLVAANGIRASIVDNGNGTKTHNWLGSNPMVPYLACFTAGPYVEINQTAGTIPIQNFVFQNQYNNAVTDFSTLPEILQFYETQFGAYPFEKYGNAVVNMTTYGAMEHQTQTTLGAQYITGNHSGEFTIAHELAHQWYGDAVSPLTFKDVWLSEGFATYSEALWMHHRDGWQAACEYINDNFRQYYISYENSAGAQTIYNPSFNNYFTPPEYEKAALVLHMLRLKMGSANFMQLLQNWFTTHRDGNVITAEFQAMAEQLSGQDMEQFFNQWIYGSGIPSALLHVMSNADTGRLKVFASTSSPTSTSFTLDIPLTLSTATSDSVLVKATPAGWMSDIPFDTTADLSTLTIDPQGWLLLRDYAIMRITLTQCLPSNNSVYLSWRAYDTGFETTSYRLWQRLEGSTEWTLAGTVPASLNSYIASNLDNGTLYYFRVTAATADGFESVPSIPMTATPVEFSFDLGMLVVDETRDGSGGAITPTDAMVDAFYAAALEPFDYTNWDYATQGAPMLNTLARYPLVLWHADDFTQNQLLSSLDLIGSYLMGGGKFILSGWKTPSVFTPSFMQMFMPDTGLYYDNGAVLNSAVSNNYPTLLPDPAKLSTVWNGLVPMVYSFQEVANVLYTGDMIDTAAGDGFPIAVRYDYPGQFVVFGFPLYSMQAAGVRGLLQQLIPELYPGVANEDETVLAVERFVCYPNPCRNSLNLSFSTKISDNPVINVFNVKGQKVITLRPDVRKAGTQSLSWDMADIKGNSLPNGVYLISLQNGSLTQTQKVILLK